MPHTFVGGISYSLRLMALVATNRRHLPIVRSFSVYFTMISEIKIICTEADCVRRHQLFLIKAKDVLTGICLGFYNLSSKGK